MNTPKQDRIIKIPDAPKANRYKRTRTTQMTPIALDFNIIPTQINPVPVKKHQGELTTPQVSSIKKIPLRPIANRYPNKRLKLDENSHNNKGLCENLFNIKDKENTSNCSSSIHTNSTLQHTGYDSESSKNRISLFSISSRSSSSPTNTSSSSDSCEDVSIRHTL